MLRITITITLLFFSLLIQANESSLQLVPEKGTVSVVGDGYVELVPDVIDIQFTLMVTKNRIGEAKNDLDEQYKRVLEVLRQQDIQDSDIQATRLRSNPSYEWMKDQRVFKGFQMSRNIKVTVRDASQYATLLEGLVDVNVTTINQVSTRFSDEVETQELALIEAVKVAKRKAKLMASQFGKNLGEVIYISEGTFQKVLTPVQFNRNRALAVEQDSGVAPPPEMFGLQRVNARIQVTFHLK